MLLRLLPHSFCKAKLPCRSRLLCALPILLIFTRAYPQELPPVLEEALVHKMESVISRAGKHPVPNFLLYLQHAPKERIFYQGVGTIGRNDHPIDADFQFNVASITKTFVATLVLQLMEEGKLRLQDRIGPYLRPLEFVRYDELHLYQGQPYQDSITIHMLLNHRSGIADVFTDAQMRFNLSVLLHPKRQYSPQAFFERYYHALGQHRPGQPSL